MGSTLPSFRQAVLMEYRKWKPFRRALEKSERQLFDQMWELTALYNSAMSYCANPFRIYPILMSMLLHNCQQLTDLENIVVKLDRSIRLDKEVSEYHI